MRRQDREAMRGKPHEDRRSDREEAAPEFEREDRERMRDSMSSEEERPKPQHPGGRLPLPE